MSDTNFGLLTTEQKTVWSMDTWRTARNMSFWNQMLGEGPNSCVQHITELTKTEKGARAVITLVPDLEGDGVAGDSNLEGREEQIKAYDQVIRIDQLRNANRSEGRMAEQKSIVRFRETSRDVLAYWLADRTDQLGFLTAAGIAYTQRPDGGTRVGSEFPQLEFAADVSAPTSQRRLRWDATNSVLVSNAATSAVTATDFPSWKMLVNLKAYAKTQYIRGIRGPGGKETFKVVMSPTGVARLKQDADYLAALRHAKERGSDNELFTGDVPTVDGLTIYEHRHLPTTAGASSGSKFGGAGTVEGQHVLFLGAQAMGMADIGDAMWEEKEFDYNAKPGISIAKIFGLRKPKFITQYGPGAGTEQDFGVIVCYTAV